VRNVVPDHIIAQWAIRAADPEANQRRYHSVKHQWPIPREYETCWKCDRERAVCRGKMRFESMEAAYEVCDKINYPTRHKLIIPYICKWGEGLHFHNRTALTTSEKRKARKRLVKVAMSA
jgi:hypothetical protein